MKALKRDDEDFQAVERFAARIEHGRRQEHDEEVRACQTARRIVLSHGGLIGLRRLVKMFEDQVPGSEIARSFRVSRQCVSQWRRALGTEVAQWVPRSGL